MLFGQSANRNDFAATSRNGREKNPSLIWFYTNINHVIIYNTEAFHSASLRFILIKYFF